MRHGGRGNVWDTQAHPTEDKEDANEYHQYRNELLELLPDGGLGKITQVGCRTHHGDGPQSEGDHKERPPCRMAHGQGAQYRHIHQATWQ